MSSSDRRIELKVGEDRRLPLTGAGSNGWEWHLAQTGDSVTATIGSTPPLGPAVTGSYPMFLHIIGICCGETTICLTLVREVGRPPREVLTILVAVAP